MTNPAVVDFDKSHRKYGAHNEALLSAQRDVLEGIVRGEPLREVLAALCRIVEAQAERDVRAAILLLDDATHTLSTGAAPSLPDDYNSAVDGIGVAPDVGTCCKAAALREIIVTPCIDSDAGWAKLKHLPLGLGLKAAWSMPIYASNGDVIGTFGTYFTETRHPTALERQLVEVLAPTAALAIERARSDAELRAAASRHRFLADLAAATQPLVDPAEMMATSAQLLAEHLRVDRCAYAEVENERVFVITGDYSRSVPSIVGRWDVAAFGPPCVEAMLEGRPYVVTDALKHPALNDKHRAAYEATDIRAVICVPLHKKGTFTAAMAVHQSTPRRWSPADIDLVATVVGRCWEALERSRIARDLRASEARYRAIVEASPECVKLVAADGRLLQMNAAGLRMIEATDEAQAIGSCVYDLAVPEYRAAFRDLNERVCRGESGALSFEIVGLQGTRRSMETTAVPLQLPSGELAQLALTRDVSERVATERALADSRARLDYAVRLSGVGFWYCDLPFDQLDWDSRVRQHFFMSPHERVTLDTFFERIHPDDRELVRHEIDESIELHLGYDVVYRTVSPETGAIKHIRALGGAAYGADGTPLRFDGVTVDVTEQRRHQEQLGRLLDQQREQDRRKDEFLATLAHELRNPLAPIRTGLQVLQLTRDADQTKKTHQMMQRQLGHLVRMVDDLLDISRITLGKVQLKKEVIDFSTTLHSALETTRPLIESNGHELVVEIPERSIPILADATRIAQVIANLLNNAAKYTPAGGRIELAARVENQQLIVRVIDSGIGIPDEMLHRIFDMFTQVSRSMDHAQGGLGVGLTLVRKLVELHDGTIRADSAGVGKGSVFTLTLPMAIHDAVSATAENIDQTATEALRVLVVDDNADAADTLGMLLELQGHVTKLAYSGPDALAAAEEFKPDVAFLDIGLPGFDGYEVAKRLQANPRSCPHMLVALTGWGSESDRARSRDAGFHGHLVKPVDVARLSEVLKEAQSARATRH